MKVFRVMVSIIIAITSIKVFSADIPVTKDTTIADTKGSSCQVDASDERSTANGRE